MKITTNYSPRKATWLAFGLVAFAVITSAHEQDSGREESVAQTVFDAVPLATTSALSDATSVPVPVSGKETSAENQEDDTTEAKWAYREAMATLTSLHAYPSQYTFDPALLVTQSNSRSLFSSFLPTLQGQGPIGSAVRILLKLHHAIFSRFSGIVGQEGLGLGSTKKDEEMRRKAIKVMDLLQHSAELGNADALFMLGHISLFPPNEFFNLDPSLAYQSLSQHAEETGNATSQSYLAFFHATGYMDVVPVDQARSMLYATFAANGGDKGAQMMLGYRFWSGISTAESCRSALSWYGSAAERAMAKYLSGPPGGRTLPQTPTRLSDLAGGVYGAGASVASTGVNTQRPAIKAGIARAAGETWNDVVEYYSFSAERGEIDFLYRLGKIFYHGSIYTTPGGIASGSEGVGAYPRSFKLARKYFLRIARQVWPLDPPATTTAKDENKPVVYASASAAYIGRMYLRGEGIKADPVMAKAWFERGAEHGDRECHNALGIMHRDGLIPGKKADVKQALHHFNIAAGQELAEATVNLGKHYYSRGELALATTYFETAVRYGSPFEAYYYLAEIQSAQATSPTMLPHVVSSSCAMAVSFYKLVAERGAWGDDLLREAEKSWMTGTQQGKQVAMLKWWIAAERGSEIAQNNLAYVLDQDKSPLQLATSSPTISPSNDTARLALTQWTRAAGQRNIDALVKVGDYYYYGLGVPEESEKSRLEKAAKYYQSAADTQTSALAMWNLGWMYENGIGVPQDFHLAKRHYDSALETNSEAYLPVMLSLAKLYARSIWHTAKGGDGGLKLWGSDEDETSSKGAKQPSDGRQLEDGRTKEEVAGNTPTPREDRARRDEEDGPWYIGRAKEEFHRRRANQGQGNRLDDETDAVQWAQERRDADRERDSDFGPEDYFEGALRGNREDIEFDEFGETLVLILLCLVISVLLYIRTRIIERMRREQRQQQQGEGPGEQPQRPNGFFPPPGDPARNEWAILR